MGGKSIMTFLQTGLPTLAAKLSKMVDTFIVPLEASKLLEASDMSIIFQNLDELARIYAEMGSLSQTLASAPSVGVNKLVEFLFIHDFIQAHAQYCEGIGAAQERAIHLIGSNKRFAAHVQEARAAGSLQSSLDRELITPLTILSSFQKSVDEYLATGEGDVTETKLLGKISTKLSAITKGESHLTQQRMQETKLMQMELRILHLPERTHSIGQYLVSQIVAQVSAASRSSSSPSSLPTSLVSSKSKTSELDVLITSEQLIFIKKSKRQKGMFEFKFQSFLKDISIVDNSHLFSSSDAHIKIVFTDNVYFIRFESSDAGEAWLMELSKVCTYSTSSAEGGSKAIQFNERAKAKKMSQSKEQSSTDTEDVDRKHRKKRSTSSSHSDKPQLIPIVATASNLARPSSPPPAVRASDGKKRELPLQSSSTLSTPTSSSSSQQQQQQQQQQPMTTDQKRQRLQKSVSVSTVRPTGSFSRVVSPPKFTVASRSHAVDDGIEIIPSKPSSNKVRLSKRAFVDRSDSSDELEDKVRCESGAKPSASKPPGNSLSSSSAAASTTTALSTANNNNSITPLSLDQVTAASNLKDSGKKYQPLTIPAVPALEASSDYEESEDEPIRIVHSHSQPFMQRLTIRNSISKIESKSMRSIAIQEDGAMSPLPNRSSSTPEAEIQVIIKQASDSSSGPASSIEAEKNGANNNNSNKDVKSNGENNLVGNLTLSHDGTGAGHSSAAASVESNFHNVSNHHRDASQSICSPSISSNNEDLLSKLIGIVGRMERELTAIKETIAQLQAQSN